MVFATREEEIDYLRDELERAGYDESSNQKWDEATLGRVRKLKLLEEEAPRRRRADVYDESGSDEEESESDGIGSADQGQMMGQIQLETLRELRRIRQCRRDSGSDGARAVPVPAPDSLPGEDALPARRRRRRGSGAKQGDDSDSDGRPRRPRHRS